jgi:hypothetical protein
MKKQRFEFGHGASLVAGNGINDDISLICKVLKFCSRLSPPPRAALPGFEYVQSIFRFYLLLSSTPGNCASMGSMDILGEIKYKKTFYP